MPTITTAVAPTYIEFPAARADDMGQGWDDPAAAASRTDARTEALLREWHPRAEIVCGTRVSSDTPEGEDSARVAAERAWQAVCEEG